MNKHFNLLLEDCNLPYVGYDLRFGNLILSAYGLRDYTLQNHQVLILFDL